MRSVGLIDRGSPSVMLSPNATNRVAEIRGGSVTVTLKLHDASRWRASVAVHMTVVEPLMKVAPLAGVQAVVTGWAPPTTIGAAYVTASG
jgi:hypothetical protein